jgi:clan AA aspartic protease (TIGR02281 family)
MSSAGAEQTSYDKGISFYKSGRYEEAVSCFRSAAERNINKPTSIYYMAMCYQQLGSLQEAHDSYKYVCTNFPNAPVADKSFEMMKQIGAKLAAQDQSRQSGRSEDKPVVLPSTGSTDKAGAAPAMAAGAYVLKYTEDAMDGRMYLDGVINKKKCRILFDTGSGVTFCRQSFLDKNNWKFNWIKENAIIPGAMKEAPAKVAVVKVGIGPLVREDKIYVEQDPPESLYASYDNCPIIGQSFFGDLTYEIDSNRKWIIFRPKGKVRTAKDPPIKLKANEVPFTREGHHIVVKTKVNNRECEMYLDTGASQVVFADRHLAQCGLNRPVEATTTVKRTVDGRRDSYAFTIDNIKLGPIEKTEVNAAVLLNTKFAKPLLGQSFLQGLRYTVDPARNVIRFEQ